MSFTPGAEYASHGERIEIQRLQGPKTTMLVIVSRRADGARVLGVVEDDGRGWGPPPTTPSGFPICSCSYAEWSLRL